MSASRRFIGPDFRGRFALGQFIRHDLYLLTVDEKGVITLTPADVLPLPKPPAVRKRPTRPRKKAASAAVETPKEQEQ